MTALVVLGDVHGNARALRAALDQARRGPMDRLVFVGDLLTYGHDVDEVLDLVAQAQARDGAAVVIGNHDQMYFELAEGRRDYVEGLPAWIQDSVALTVERLGARRLRDLLRWSAEDVADGVLVSHASPFGAGDWRYLVDELEAPAARDALASRGLRVGIFGHTHRPRWVGLGRSSEPALDATLEADLATPLLVNAGSVGQPRDERRTSVILRLELAGHTARARFEPIVYDLDGHLAGIARSGLPDPTLRKLRAFFQP